MSTLIHLPRHTGRPEGRRQSSATISDLKDPDRCAPDCPYVGEEVEAS